MLNRVLRPWLVRKSRFAEALVRRQGGREWTSGEELWCLYRLGMYRSVADRVQRDADLRGGFARTVSLAACGRMDEAEAAARSFLTHRESIAQCSELSDALAPFALGLALEICKLAPDSSPVLRAALCLRSVLEDDARQIIQGALERGEAARYPELHLLHSNAFQPAPLERLSDLNAFLRANGVPEVTLISEDVPPSALNVQCAEAASVFDGPLVTVLMTTFRTGHRADAAIASVLAQSYRNLELIVVDDASDDETPAIIEGWAARDDRVRFIRLGCNGGTYIAKSIGFEHARGEFVTCHDSDDWSHPLKIERQVRPLLSDRRLVASMSLYLRIQDDGDYYARSVHPLMRINPSSLLFRRREVVQGMGIWDCVRMGADSEFMVRMRLVFGRKAVKRISQPLSLGAHRADSLMTASSTGYSDAGLSPKRLDYWEAWSKWHIECLAKREKPRMPSRLGEMLAERPFAVASEMMVDAEHIRACIESAVVHG